MSRKVDWAELRITRGRVLVRWNVSGCGGPLDLYATVRVLAGSVYLILLISGLAAWWECRVRAVELLRPWLGYVVAG